MVRRFFISAFTSVIALTASALDPASAAETQNAAMQPRTPSFPEPDPIVLDSATVDRARRLLDAIARGTFDRSELAPQLGDVSPDFFAKGAAYVSALGPPQSMYPYEKRIRAEQTLTYFLVRYPKEILTWVVGVNAANRVTLLSLQRSPGNEIFTLAWKDYGY